MRSLLSVAPFQTLLTELSINQSHLIARLFQPLCFRSFAASILLSVLSTFLFANLQRGNLLKYVNECRGLSEAQARWFFQQQVLALEYRCASVSHKWYHRYVIATAHM